MKAKNANSFSTINDDYFTTNSLFIAYQKWRGKWKINK
jgi:hypothetical protein